MLKIHKVTSATNAKAYYAASDYYTEGQELVGRWGGKLADRLGLVGTVDKARFDRLCDNLHPHADRSLTPRTNDARRVAYDFVFSGPKSFSIVEALASPEERQRLLEAFDAAVTETMEKDVEPDMLTRIRRSGEDVDRKTQNAVWATFDHSTARPVGDHPPDMHRHKHVVVFNATYDPVEHRIKAGQFHDTKRDGEYYAAAFYARLGRRLEAMGYSIDRRGGKEWEIIGVPQAVIDKFSKRTDEVEDEHANRLDKKHPDYDPDYRPEYKHELGAKTRAGKQKELTPAELRTAWYSQLTDAERRELATVFAKQSGPSKEVSPAAAVAFAIAHCSEQLSVVPERELKRVALLHGLGHVLPEAIAAELPRQGVIVRDIDGRTLATTQDLLAEERAIISLAANGRGSVAPVGVPEGLTRVLPDGNRLNDEQWSVVLGLLGSSNRVEIFEGPAGSGKSWSLQKYDEAMRRQGESVVYLAVSSDAVGVLQKHGFEANTVARFLVDQKLQDASRGKRVVVDESSLLGHKDAYRLFDLAGRLDAKLVMMGDEYQHGSVPRGALLRVLKQYGGLTPFRLEEIKRQENSDYLAAAKLLSKGETLAGFDAIDRLGWIKEVSDADRYRQMAAEYVQAVQEKKSVLAISPTWAEARRITQEIREQLRQAGKLGTEEKEFVRLVASNFSEAQRGQASTYRPGQVLVFYQNAKGGFKKGDRLVVADPAKVPISEAKKFQVYEPEKISLSKGDRIRFTSGVRTRDGKHRLSNGATYEVAGFSPGNNIRLENGWIVSKDVGHFRSGFVESSFGSQGRTVDRVLLGISAASLPATNQEQMYVSSTRARERMTLYADQKDAVRRSVERSSAKLAALDLVPKDLVPKKPNAFERVRRHMQRLRRLAVIDRVRQAWEAHRPEREKQVSYGRG